ncbi:hypothetical protein PIB30_013030 [Stylosanthes scabra]|uniref:Uncharacterized protein n=1 Tax=Stylosanthes scabra TaxID=79078 RepID=A0ABU6S6M3_9FABA|nr:hypothetical protein [Stylosanthes scabra]
MEHQDETQIQIEFLKAHQESDDDVSLVAFEQASFLLRFTNKSGWLTAAVWINRELQALQSLVRIQSEQDALT